MLSSREQRWALRQFVEGVERQVSREQFSEGLRDCWDAVCELPAGERKFALLEFLAETRPDGQQVYKAVVECTPPTSAQYPAYSDLDIPPIRWFWRGWMAKGLLTLLAGAPGSGKSLVAQDLAYRLTNGLGAPDGSPLVAESTSVIYVDAEDVPAITKERGQRWKMDLGQMYPMLPRPYSLIDFGGPGDRDRLIEMAHTLKPGLVIVDSLSRISSRGDSNVEEVRPVLSFLSELAKDLGCAVLLIHHLRKRMANMLPGMELTMDDVRGSGDIAAAARVIVGLSIVRTGPEVDLNGPRKLGVLKSNLGRVPDAIGCTFVPLEPEGVMVDYGEAPESWREPTEADKCAEWLLCLIESNGGKIKPRDAVEQATGEGYSRATVYKARRMCDGKLRNTRGAKSPSNEWALADVE